MTRPPVPTYAPGWSGPIPLGVPTIDLGAVSFSVIAYIGEEGITYVGDTDAHRLVVTQAGAWAVWAEPGRHPRVVASGVNAYRDAERAMDAAVAAAAEAEAAIVAEEGE